MRIGNMIAKLLEEVRAAPLTKPAAIGYAISTPPRTRRWSGLERARSRPAYPAVQRVTPCPEAELCILLQAQLVGWLEGLFHGIQTALFTSKWRRARSRQPGALPPGSASRASTATCTGQYLCSCRIRTILAYPDAQRVGGVLSSTKSPAEEGGPAKRAPSQ